MSVFVVEDVRMMMGMVMRLSLDLMSARILCLFFFGRFKFKRMRFG